jgi:hypothetical protein
MIGLNANSQIPLPSPFLAHEAFFRLEAFAREQLLELRRALESLD